MTIVSIEVSNCHTNGYDTIQPTVKFESHFREKNHLRKVRYTISDAKLPVDSKINIKNTPIAG